MSTSKNPTPRWRRWLKRTVQTGAACIVILAAATLRPVDHGPWLQSDAATHALADAEAMQRELTAARPAPLEAGWSSAPLDLHIGEPMAGYGARRGAASVGVDDPLYAHALCLRAGSTEVVLVAVDALLVHAGVARETVRLCAAQGIGEQAIYFTATHTHCGPGGWGPNAIEQAVCGRYDEEAVHRLARVLAQVIVAAHSAPKPAEWAWLEMAVPEHVRNRTIYGGIIDPSFDALAVRQMDGGATGVFAIYGAHATCHGSHEMKFSGDYPGALVRHLEAGGLAFAAFAAGAVASQSPVGDGDEAERADGIGADLAQRVLAGIKGAAWKREITLASVRHDVPLPTVQIRLGHQVRLATWIADAMHGRTAPFHLLRLDDHRMAGLPIEFSAMLSAPLRAEAGRIGVHLCVTPFNGDYTGYVLPVSNYDVHAYEAGMDFLGPWGGEYFAELIRAGLGLEHAQK